MNLMLLFILIGLTVGLLANVLRNAGGYAFLGDLLIGGLGALLGGFLFRFANGGRTGLLWAMAAAVIGAAFLVLDLRLYRRRFAGQFFQRVHGSHRTSLFKRCPRVESPQETSGSICRVCGQRHLL